MQLKGSIDTHLYIFGHLIYKKDGIEQLWREIKGFSQCLGANWIDRQTRRIDIHIDKEFKISVIPKEKALENFEQRGELTLLLFKGLTLGAVLTVECEESNVAMRR